jgi:hypothetical protein
VVNKSRRRTPTERAEGRLTLFPSAGVTMALLFVSVGSSRGGAKVARCSETRLLSCPAGCHRKRA